MMLASLESTFLKAWLMPGTIFLHQAIQGIYTYLNKTFQYFLYFRVVPAKAEFITAPVECASVGKGLSLETETIGYLDVSSTR